MSQKEEEPGLFSRIVGAAIAFPVVAIFFAVIYLGVAIFWWVKKPVTDALGLHLFSSRTRLMRWFPTAGMVVTVIVFLMVASTTYREFAHVRAGIEHLIAASFSIGIGLLVLFVLVVFHWLALYANDPDVQKKVAGIKAELFVQKLIEANQHKYPQCRSIHGVLCVFNFGTPEEFSAEIDHLLVTQHQIYIIETKYKSGTIVANADAPAWQTSTPHASGSMRNALAQVKNTARVLHRELELPVDIIPMVAIHGNDVNVAGGLGNVVSSPDLIKTIDAFEATGERNTAHIPEAIIEKFLQIACKEDDAMSRHNERAQTTKARAEMENIVRTSSIK